MFRVVAKLCSELEQNRKKKLEHITTVRNTTKMLQYFKRQSSLLSTEQPGRCVRECRYLHASWLQQRQQRSIHFPKVLPGCWVRKVGWHARKKKLPNSAHEVAIQWFFLFYWREHTHTRRHQRNAFFSLFSPFFLLVCDHMFSVSIICIREWFFSHPLGWVVFPGLPLP